MLFDWNDWNDLISIFQFFIYVHLSRENLTFYLIVRNDRAEDEEDDEVPGDRRREGRLLLVLLLDLDLDRR